MRKTLFSVLLLACVYANGQSVQYGYTEEYRGAKDKKPLTGVNINAGGATTKSGSGGKFKLEFNSLKVGDRVNADVNNVANLKGYVLFNKEAVEQWTVSGKSVYFRIVLCKKKTFDDLVMTYYNVSDKSLKQQLKREQERAKQALNEQRIQQQEYERMLKEADERYQRDFKTIKEKAELVARIDESELEGDQKEILRLAKEGKLDEAVELIKKSKDSELLDNATRKRNYAAEQKEYFEQKEAEAKAEIKRFADKMRTNIKIMQLLGGKENLDLCGEYWQMIIAADTTVVGSVREGALFFDDQRNFELAEKYYQMGLTECERLAKLNPGLQSRELYLTLCGVGYLYIHMNAYSKAEEYLLRALAAQQEVDDQQNELKLYNKASLHNEMGNLYYAMSDYEKSEEYFLKALAVYEELSIGKPDLYLDELASVQNNLGAVYRKEGSYKKAEEFLLKSLTTQMQLDSLNTEPNKDGIALTQMKLGLLYENIHSYTKSEEYYLKALENREQLYQQNPDAYADQLATVQLNLGSLYTMYLRSFDKAETYLLKALETYERLTSLYSNVYRHPLCVVQSNLGALYEQTRKDDKAEEFMLKSLQNCELLFSQDSDTYRYDYSKTHSHLGIYYAKRHVYDKALYHFNIDLQQCQIMFDQQPEAHRKDIASALEQVGSVYFDLRQYDKSEEYRLKALEHREILFGLNPDAGRYGMAGLQAALGSLYQKMHQYSNSEKYFKGSLSNYELLYANNPRTFGTELAMITYYTMKLYREMNELDTFYQYICKTKKIHGEVFDHESKMYKGVMIDMANNMAYYRLMKGEFEKLDSVIDELYALDSARCASIIASTCNDVAYRHAKEKHYVEAIKCVDKAIEMMPQSASLYDTKGEILLMKGDVKGALQMWQKVVELDPKLAEQFVEKGQSELYDGLKKRGLVE